MASPYTNEKFALLEAYLNILKAADLFWSEKFRALVFYLSVDFFGSQLKSSIFFRQFLHEVNQNIL